MANVSYLGALKTGHGCFPPTTAAEASPDTTVNGTQVLRQGDSFVAHACGPAVDVDSVSVGSSTVTVNGQPIARMGDTCIPGGAVAQGSPDTIAGG